VRASGIADGAKAGLIVFVAAIAQVSILSSVKLFGGTPDVLLVTIVVLALLRGSVFGAVAGFAGGLVVDTAVLGTLGATSLLLTLAGYWAGRYGETTGRDRGHAPLLCVVAVTFLYAVGGLALHFMLGEHVSGRLVLFDALLPAILFNALLTQPLYALSRRSVPPPVRSDRAGEVELLG